MTDKDVRFKSLCLSEPDGLLQIRNGIIQSYNRRIDLFESGMLVIPDWVKIARFTICGAGGGGGKVGGGGGGAMKSFEIHPGSNKEVKITIGKGGAGSEQTGKAGGSTLVAYNNRTWSAEGGGAGGYVGGRGACGSSGGDVDTMPVSGINGTGSGGGYINQNGADSEYGPTGGAGSPVGGGGGAGPFGDGGGVLVNARSGGGGGGANGNGGDGICFVEYI